MRAAKKIREIPSRLNGSFETLLAQFSVATRDLKPSIGPTAFVKRFTSSSTRILETRSAALVLVRGEDWELASAEGDASRIPHDEQVRFAQALSHLNWNPTEAVRFGSAN